jgi:hypothetical protein
MPSSGMLRRVALVRADVSEERGASIIRVTRIGEVRRLIVMAKVPRSAILVTLMIHALRSSETRFLQEPQGVISQRTTFFSLFCSLLNHISFVTLVPKYLNRVKFSKGSFGSPDMICPAVWCFRAVQHCCGRTVGAMLTTECSGSSTDRQRAESTGTQEELTEVDGNQIH